MRGVRDGVFVSEQLPPLRLRVVPPLRYIGSFTFDLENVAHVERHVSCCPITTRSPGTRTSLARTGAASC